MPKAKVETLRSKKIADLRDELKTLKTELSTLRVAQVTGGAASKLGKVKKVRKDVARVLTVINQKARENFRSQMKTEKFIPKQLRAKKTRAIRRQLTKEQKNKKTVKETKRAQNFPVLRFALKA